MGHAMDTYSAKLRQARAQLPYFPRALRLVWEAAHVWTVLWAVLLVVQGLLPVALVYLTRDVVNSAVAAAGAGGTRESLGPVLFWVVLTAVVLLTQELARSASSYVRVVQSELVTDHIYGLIHQRSTLADFAFYETPEYHDHLHRARAEAGFRPLALVEGMGTVLQNSLTLLSMLFVLAPFGWWLPPALLVSTLPALLVVIHHGARQHRWRRTATPAERRTWYYDYLLTHGETAAELRLFDLGPYFTESWRDLRHGLRTTCLGLARRQGIAEAAVGAFGLLVSAGALGVMLWRTIQGVFDLGDLALFYQAFNQGQRLMRSLLEGVGQLVSNSLFLGDLFEFLELEPGVVDPPDPLPAPQALEREIRFRGVSFRHPGEERAVLDDFHLVIPAGQVVAVVGPNGSGKTTLFKLLCRLYDPQTGSVELDGVDLRSLRLANVRRMITVLFQQPVQYALSAGENIALGDRAGLFADRAARDGHRNLDQPPASATAEGGSGEGSPVAVHPRVIAAAVASGADEVISRLPQGYDALLGKWFDGGHELSLGEWQRIALARGFLREAPILLLDEPTSAMDSWAEADWMARFRELAARRTVVVITHRFTTAMHADVIHVMVGGKIIESGDHAGLVAAGGMYARSWAAQTGVSACRSRKGIR